MRNRAKVVILDDNILCAAFADHVCQHLSILQTVCVRNGNGLTFRTFGSPGKNVGNGRECLLSAARFSVGGDFCVFAAIRLQDWLYIEQSPGNGDRFGDASAAA